MPFRRLVPFIWENGENLFFSKGGEAYARVERTYRKPLGAYKKAFRFTRQNRVHSNKAQKKVTALR